MERLDHQSQTSRLNQHTSRVETLKCQVRTLTKAIYDNNVGGHSVCAATVKNGNDNRLLELEAIVFKLNNTVNSMYEDKNDNDTTTTNSIIQQQQQQQQHQVSPSHPSNKNSVNSLNNTYVTNNLISSRSFHEIREADAKRQNFLDFFRGVQR